MNKSIIRITCCLILLLAPCGCLNGEAPTKRVTDTSGIPAGLLQSLSGTWAGELAINNIKLRIRFNVMAENRDSILVTMQSPDQSEALIPVDKVIHDEKGIRFEVKKVQGYFQGVFLEDSAGLTGQWVQMGNAFPLVLSRSDSMSQLDRPQHPQRPYPYQEDSVTFKNTRADVVLAGTLAYPKNGGPFPAAILISGSGPQNRDEYILGHKPFLVISDYLVRQGMAVLRYDDRGVGGSTGEFQNATSRDFAADAEAAIQFLRGRKEIQADRIGLIGHSEGGLIASIVAAETKPVWFIVLLASPGLSGAEILLWQEANGDRERGASAELIARKKKALREMMDLLESEPDNHAVKGKMERIAREAVKGLSEEEKKSIDYSPETLEAWASQVTTPWSRFFIGFDPGEALQKVTCPVLALNGAKDRQVEYESNLNAIKSALEKAGHRTHTIRSFPELNHLFQTCETGHVAEYREIEETFSPVALEAMGVWIGRLKKEN